MDYPHQSIDNISTNAKEMQFCALNVCGLHSKIDTDYFDLFVQYTIFCASLKERLVTLIFLKYCFTITLYFHPRIRRQAVCNS